MATASACAHPERIVVVAQTIFHVWEANAKLLEEMAQEIALRALAIGPRPHNVVGLKLVPHTLLIPVEALDVNPGCCVMLHLISIEYLPEKCLLAVSRCFLWDPDMIGLCTTCISRVIVTALDVRPEPHWANRDT